MREETKKNPVEGCGAGRNVQSLPSVVESQGGRERRRPGLFIIYSILSNIIRGTAGYPSIWNLLLLRGGREPAQFGNFGLQCYKGKILQG